mmetsp:Transcript_3972/g.11228  ORF Transcript_3972/g.11228 Transcript_3972/m.11228 type:complete len:509 (-) Transcript_3972:169-1695(-)
MSLARRSAHATALRRCPRTLGVARPRHGLTGGLCEWGFIVSKHFGEHGFLLLLVRSHLVTHGDQLLTRVMIPRVNLEDLHQILLGLIQVAKAGITLASAQQGLDIVTIHSECLHGMVDYLVVVAHLEEARRLVDVALHAHLVHALALRLVDKVRVLDQAHALLVLGLGQQEASLLEELVPLLLLAELQGRPLLRLQVVFFLGLLKGDQVHAREQVRAHCLGGVHSASLCQRVGVAPLGWHLQLRHGAGLHLLDRLLHRGDDRVVIHDEGHWLSLGHRVFQHLAPRACGDGHVGHHRSAIVGALVAVTGLDELETDQVIGLVQLLHFHPGHELDGEDHARLRFARPVGVARELCLLQAAHVLDELKDSGQARLRLAAHPEHKWWRVLALARRANDRATRGAGRVAHVHFPPGAGRGPAVALARALLDHLAIAPAHIFHGVAVVHLHTHRERCVRGHTQRFVARRAVREFGGHSDLVLRKLVHAVEHEVKERREAGGLGHLLALAAYEWR